MITDLKISKNFLASEVLPPEAFEAGMNTTYLISPFLRIVPQRIRDLLGKPVILNTWNQGGVHKYRGWRPLNCKIGAKMSAHKFGMAIDIEVPGMSEKEILSWLMKNKDKFPEITRFESIVYTLGWNHFDCLYTGMSQLIEVKP